jgi:hypothetical protein
MRSSSEIRLYTGQWMALKRSSRFISTDGRELRSLTAGCVLRLDNSSSMLAVSDCDEVTAVFVRQCYILWFSEFLAGVAERPKGKFALSSSPGCGKTMATNVIFKLANSTPLLQDKPILYQFSSAFFYFHSDKVISVDRNKAIEFAVLPETFYILDGRDADPVHSICLTLFISPLPHPLPRQPNKVT